MTAVAEAPTSPRWSPPTRNSTAVFAFKVALLRLRRFVVDLAAAPPRLMRSETAGFGQVLAASRTPLWTDTALAERVHQLGKVENLRRAGHALDGLVIPGGATFSFWRQVGPPLAVRGFVAGRMLQQGCLIPAVGGGLCQLSNALHDVALAAGCTIVERHAHTRIVPGSAAAAGRDATVAWNYVDLRFAADRDLRLSVRLDADELIVRLDGRGDGRAAAPAPLKRAAVEDIAPRSCGTCDEVTCFRHGPAPVSRDGGRVFLVDEAWPEIQAYVVGERKGGDRLGVPIDGAALDLARYAWRRDGFARVAGAPLAALGRAAALRMAGPQGAARRRAELAAAERIARSLARLLTPEVQTVTVAQSLLPFLWRDGRLGGREVTVLMTRLPMAALQQRLDRAAADHPDQATLADFRAPAWLVDCEGEALAAAACLVTPHAEIAALFGDRAVRIAWSAPPASPDRPTTREPFIAFPGPTVARKGALAVREAARALGLEVMPLGSELEGADFWRGVRLRSPGDWRAAAAVVQPAVVEDQPRRLLAALAAGVPVIATAACGLDPQPGLTLIPPNDARALERALKAPPRPGSRSGSPGSAET
ncbi:MAG TPA: VanW family protein [Caulobacteraceae bacterium]